VTPPSECGYSAARGVVYRTYCLPLRLLLIAGNKDSTLKAKNLTTKVKAKDPIVEEKCEN